MQATVAALFDDMERAHNAIVALEQRGYTRDQMGIMANESAHALWVNSPRYVTDAGDAMLQGIGVGAAGGAVVGLAYGLTALAIPGLGPAFAAGVLFSTLSGAMLGGATGGIVGALVEIGVPRDYAEYYAEGIRRGGSLVTVRTDEARTDLARDLLKANGAINIDERVGEWRESGWVRYDPNAPAVTPPDTEIRHAA